MQSCTLFRQAIFFRQTRVRQMGTEITYIFFIEKLEQGRLIGCESAVDCKW